MDALLALDQGTSSSRAMVFAATAGCWPSAQRELTQHFPQPGWVEHDAVEIWEGQLACAREALTKAGVKAAAIGITNQRETVVLWDRRTGEPLHKALVWQDRRTAAYCETLRQQGHGAACPRADRAAAGPVFLRHQAALAARQHARCPRARRARRAGLWHRGQLAAVES